MLPFPVYGAIASSKTRFTGTDKCAFLGRLELMIPFREAHEEADQSDFGLREPRASLSKAMRMKDGPLGTAPASSHVKVSMGANGSARFPWFQQGRRQKTGYFRNAESLEGRAM